MYSFPDTRLHVFCYETKGSEANPGLPSMDKTKTPCCVFSLEQSPPIPAGSSYPERGILGRRTASSAFVELSYVCSANSPKGINTAPETKRLPGPVCRLRLLLVARVLLAGVPRCRIPNAVGTCFRLGRLCESGHRWYGGLNLPVWLPFCGVG